MWKKNASLNEEVFSKYDREELAGWNTQNNSQKLEQFVLTHPANDHDVTERVKVNTLQDASLREFQDYLLNAWEAIHAR